MRLLEGNTYYTVEDIEASLLINENVQRNLQQIIMKAQKNKKAYVNLCITNKTSSLYGKFQIFQKLNVKFIRKRMKVIRDLNNMKIIKGPYTLRKLGEISKNQFMNLWKLCKASKQLNEKTSEINKEFQDFRYELGEGYEASCLAVYENNHQIGIMLPHIEPGTTDEGRFFFLGILPEYRGKGYGVRMYRQGLAILKNQFHAKTYVGTTDEHNIPMLSIFKRNGCLIKEYVFVYRVYL